MTALTLTAFAVFWVVCGVLAYGGSLAHYQRSFPIIARSDFGWQFRFCLLMSICGPFTVLSFAFFSWNVSGRPFRHGFMFRNPHEPRS